MGIFSSGYHGILLSILDGTISRTREFHEQDLEVKKAFYSRDLKKAVRYQRNYDLFLSRAANWRDTLNVSMFYLDQIDPNELPQVCRASIMDYIKHIPNLGHTIRVII